MGQIKSLLWNILVRTADNEQINCLKSGSLETGCNEDLHGGMDALRKDAGKGVREENSAGRS